MSPSVSIRLLLTQSDARLVSYARAGHERAFEALVQRHRRPLLGYCRRLLLADEHAEDALQQAFLHAWLALRGGAEVGEVKPWLYRIVHNTALNVLRVSGYDYCTLSESLSGADAPQADLDRRIAVREALAGLAALPHMQREALLRTAVEGRTHQQVARDLGLSEHALRGLVYRARTTLRAAASALTPPPLVSWALGSGGRGASVVERLGELGTGGGSVGIAGLLAKGGAVAVTASVLAGGLTTAVHFHPGPSGRHSTPHGAAHKAHPIATAIVLAEAHQVSVAPAASKYIPVPQAHSDGRQTASNRPMPQSRRVGAGKPVPFTTGTKPLPAQSPPGPRGGDGARSGATGGHDHHEAEDAHTAGQLTTMSSGPGGQDGGAAQSGSGGGSSSADGGSGGGSGTSDATSSNSGDTASYGIRSDGSSAFSAPTESPELQSSSGQPSATGVNGSSKYQASPASEEPKD